MSRLEDKFNKTISEYNENVSDFHKFKFSDKEKAMFLNMMKEYGRECSQASLEKASENCYAKEIHGLCFNDNVKIEKSITNESNITLL